MGAAEWLVAGLGNPRPGDAGARHNVGFRVADALGREVGARFRGPERGALWAPAALGGRAAVLLKPQQLMNDSGPPVAAWLAALALGPDRLLVVHDDLDLAVGRLKVAAGGGHGGHRGVRSVIEAVGREFLRIRVGVGRPAEADATAYVLAPPAGDEGALLRGAEARATEAVRAVVVHGPAAAMNRFNPWRSPPAPPGPAGAAGGSEDIARGR